MSGPDVSTDKSTLVTEAVDLISSTTVLAVLYTLSVLLYYRCARLSYHQAWDADGKIRKRTLVSFGLTSLMIVCATINVVLVNRYMEIVYIDYRTLPGGPLGLEAQRHTRTIGMIGMTVALLEEIVATGVLAWRVWVVWSATRYFIPFVTLSIALYLGYTVSYILMIVVGFSKFLPNSGKVIIIMTLVLSSASTIFMTSVVILRLMLARRQHIKLMGKTEDAGHYLSIAAMLVESYALMTIWIIADLINYIARDKHAGIFFNNLVVQIRVLSYLLVAFRVYSGRAWDTQTGRKLSTMRWNRSSDDVTSTSATGRKETRIDLEMKPSTLNLKADV